MITHTETEAAAAGDEKTGAVTMIMRRVIYITASFSLLGKATQIHKLVSNIPIDDNECVRAEDDERSVLSYISHQIQELQTKVIRRFPITEKAPSSHI